MGLKKRKAYEFEIIDLAAGGKGLAKPDGLPVFIDRCLPGDRVLAKVVKKKKSWAEARLIEIIEPSGMRTDGRCRYCRYCGGCKWQQLPYEKQLEYKHTHVTDALAHIGRLKDVPVEDIIGSEKIYAFRNKMEFSCSSKRWLLPSELSQPDILKDFGIGLHVPGTFDKVIDIKQCEIMPSLGNQILEDVRQFIKESGLPAYHLRNHDGFWRFLMLRHSVAYDQWMVNIVTKTRDLSMVRNLSDRLTGKYSQIASVMNNITDSKSGVSTGMEEHCLAGEDHIREKLGEFEFKVSANSFFQTNTRACEQLYTIVSEYAQLSNQKDTVMDLYSGTGTIPIWLSRQARKIYGIEIVAPAVLDARQNADLNDVDNCEFLLGDIKDVLPTISSRPDVVVIDPPRVGMHKDVVRQLMDLSAQRMVYVSCNPATLARDLEMLSAGYEILKVQPVDMFPHTFHIESVAQLVRRSRQQRV